VAVSAVLISLIPLIYLLVRVATIGISEIAELIFQTRTLELIINSLSLAFAVSVSALALGSMQAWVTASNFASGSIGRAYLSNPADLPAGSSGNYWN